MLEPAYSMFRRTSVVITTIGASELIELSPVSRPTLSAAVAADQVGVLLVAQGLDRGGVEALLPALQGQVDGELADQRLPGAGGRGDQHLVTVLEGGAGAQLELVQLEVVERPELLHGGMLLVRAEHGILLGRSAHPRPRFAPGADETRACAVFDGDLAPLAHRPQSMRRHPQSHAGSARRRRGVVERLVGLRHHADEVLVDVRRAGDHVQADVDLLLRGAGREPRASRRAGPRPNRPGPAAAAVRSGPRAPDWPTRPSGRGRRGSGDVLVHVRTAEQRVEVTPGVHARTGQRDIGPRREHDHTRPATVAPPRGPRAPSRARAHHRPNRPATRFSASPRKAPCTPPTHRRPPRGTGAPAPGGTPATPPAPGAAREWSGQIGPGPGRADHVAAAVQVQDHAVPVGTRRPGRPAPARRRACAGRA